MVKIFNDRRHDDLGSAVQAWLDENPTVRITGMAASSCEHGHTVTLLAEAGREPHRYRFLAFFGHTFFGSLPAEEIEREAQQTLAEADRPVFVAQTTNEHGLFLALLTESIT